MKKVNFIQLLGISIMIFAVAANPFTIEQLYSLDQQFDSIDKYFIIGIFDIFIFLLGLLIFRKTKWFIARKKEFILLFISFLFIFVTTEIAVRLIGEYDIDGIFWVKNKALKPYHLPYQSLVKVVDNPKEYYIQDSNLGWTLNPNAKEGLYKTNSIGIRNDKEFSLEKPLNVLRLTLFGDSYIHGNDFPLQETLSYYLGEKSVGNFKIEAMNFGVPAYGIDQAYLRWKHQGSQYNPDIVLIGFQAENCKRNLNVIPKFYFQGGVSLAPSKPRFILFNNKLSLINYPTIDYTQVPEMVRNFDQSSLVKYEFFYHPRDYSKKRFYQYSKLLSLLFWTYQRNAVGLHEIISDEDELCYAIIDKFIEEASKNSKVYLVHIPQRVDLKQKLSNKPLAYQSLLLRLKNNFTVIDPTNNLINETKKSSLNNLFGPEANSHYSGVGNKIIADVVYDNITFDLK